MRKVLRHRNWTLLGFLMFGVCLVPMFLIDNVRDGGTVWAVVAAVTATVFVVAYAVFANWRRNPDGTPNHSGQHLMTMTVALGSVFWLVVAARFGLIPMSWGPYLVYTIYTAMAFLLIWRLVLLIELQVQARRKRRAGSGVRRTFTRDEG